MSSKMPTFHCRKGHEKLACFFAPAQHKISEGSRICMECQSEENKK